MILTPVQTIIIALAFTTGTVITRFLPFIIFRGNSSNNSYINYLGESLPYSAIGMLVVYCLREVSLAAFPHGIPEAIAIACIAILHYRKENTLLSIGIGTIIYMVLIQVIFV